MAKVFPDGWRELTATGAAERELQTLAKKYLEREKNVPCQMARSADALHRRLRKACGEQATFVDSLLYCPDPFVREQARSRNGGIGQDAARAGVYRDAIGGGRSKRRPAMALTCRFIAQPSNLRYVHKCP